MVERNSFIRAANELSLAVWFGGALMGATGLERGAEAADGDKHRVESTAWSAWQPIQVAAIATQVASGAALTFANRKRVAGQRGVARTSAIRTGLTGAAIAMTVLAARSGSKVAAEVDDESELADDDVERDERRVRMAQWMVPALTGALVVMDAFMGEQQRPNQVLRGALERVLPDSLRAA
ncbi:MAG TPA: hypothetical protein VK549_07000 [Acidimicrobiia bacterium]|nr:hypothetical protein [Acidimicrobiia bacterium]